MLPLILVNLLWKSWEYTCDFAGVASVYGQRLLLTFFFCYINSQTFVQSHLVVNDDVAWPKSTFKWSFCFCFPPYLLIILCWYLNPLKTDEIVSFRWCCTCLKDYIKKRSLKRYYIRIFILWSYQVQSYLVRVSEHSKHNLPT